MSSIRTVLTSITIVFLTIHVTAAQSLISPFGVNFAEVRGQIYENAVAYHFEYKHRWFTLLSTDIFIRNFLHSSHEVGGGVTLRLPVIQLFYAQAVIGRPINSAFPDTEVFATCSIGFPFKPDYSYAVRGGMFMPLGDLVTSPFYITFSAGKSWYVDRNYRRARWIPSFDQIFPGEYEVRTSRSTRDYLILEAGIGIHF